MSILVSSLTVLTLEHGERESKPALTSANFLIKISAKFLISTLETTEKISQL